MTDVQVVTTIAEAIMLKGAKVEAFKRELRGNLFRPSEAGYVEARTTWNAIIDKRQALIACCDKVADVMKTSSH